MSSWIQENWRLAIIITIYLVGYVIIKHFLKTFLINRSKKSHSR